MIRRSRKSKYIFKSVWKRLGAKSLDVLGQAALAWRVKKPWDLSLVRRVLVVRMDQIGDVIFAAPALEYLYEILPQAQIDMMVGPWSAPLAKNFPHVCEVLTFQNNWYDPDTGILHSLRHARKILKLLRSRRYDLGIDLRGDFRTIVLLRAAGITRTLSYGITGGNFLLDRTVPYDFSAHQVDLNLRLMAEVAAGLNGSRVSAPTKEERKPRLSCPEEWMQAVRDKQWIVPDRPTVLIHTEAGYPSKRWNKARYVQLLTTLIQRNLQLVLVGTRKDDLLETPELKPYVQKIQDLRGKTDLLELCGLIAQADLLIGNDSAPAHIAAALGTPSVVLFSGANDPARWRPVGRQVRLLFHPVRCSPCESRQCRMPMHECMDAISVHEVEGCVDDMLAAKGTETV